MLFVDRTDAGRRLAQKLGHLRGADVVVVGLPRGGVPVAFEVAKALAAPLDVILVRKLGVPFQPELGMGAIGEDGVRVVNHDLVLAARVSACGVRRGGATGTGRVGAPGRAVPAGAAEGLARGPHGGRGRRRDRHWFDGSGGLSGGPSPRSRPCGPGRSGRPAELDGGPGRRRRRAGVRRDTRTVLRHRDVVPRFHPDHRRRGRGVPGSGRGHTRRCPRRR